MRKSRVVTSLTCLVCAANLLGAGNSFKSGLQPAEMIPSAFEPLNVTGKHAGERHCLVCENGLCPVVMIFAREVSEPLVYLLVKVDAATTQHRAHELGSFVVFLSAKEKLDKQLQVLAKKKELKHIVLSIDEPAGPEDYKVAKDADVTVVLYHKHVVKANHAFKKGELSEKSVEKVLADLPKIIPSK